jgi:DNA-binding NarL/FixJ family response regulator
MPETISLAIAEDHPYFSKGVANVLGISERYHICVFIERAEDILTHLQQHQSKVLLLDINMSGYNTLSLLPAIRKQHPDLKVLVLSMYQPGEVDFEIHKRYIDGYVLKNSGAEILQHALQAITDGRQYIDPNALESVSAGTDRFINKLKLSLRETEILQLLKEGHANRAIAQKLFISELTVKTHRKNIMQKMDCRNLAELIRKT